MPIKRDAADVWFSKAVRKRDGACMVCFKTEANECAHIVGRRNKAVRWCAMNALSLCHYHHRHFTENPLAFNDFLMGIYGEGHLELLREKSRAIYKTNKAERALIAKHYREELKKMEDDPEYVLVSWN